MLLTGVPLEKGQDAEGEGGDEAGEGGTGALSRLGRTREDGRAQSSSTLSVWGPGGLQRLQSWIPP